MTSSSTNPFYHTLYKPYINCTNSVSNVLAFSMWKFGCSLVLRSSRLTHGVISASSRLKCLLDRQLHFSRVLIIKSVAGPHPFRSAWVPWLGNGGLALLAECLENRIAPGPWRHSEQLSFQSTTHRHVRFGCSVKMLCWLCCRTKRKGCIFIKSLKLSIFCFLHNLVQLFIPHPMVWFFFKNSINF